MKTHTPLVYSEAAKSHHTTRSDGVKFAIGKYPSETFPFILTGHDDVFASLPIGLFRSLKAAENAIDTAAMES